MYLVLLGITGDSAASTTSELFQDSQTLTTARQELYIYIYIGRIMNKESSSGHMRTKRALETRMKENQMATCLDDRGETEESAIIECLIPTPPVHERIGSF